jgi:hypothetical protein
LQLSKYSNLGLETTNVFTISFINLTSNCKKRENIGKTP